MTMLAEASLILSTLAELAGWGLLAIAIVVVGFILPLALAGLALGRWAK